MAMNDAQQKITVYSDDFNEAFATFDGQRVASKLSFHFVARSASAESKVLHSASELARYFQGYLKGYREKGCLLCRYSDLRIAMLGAAVAAASVRWSLLDRTNTTVLSWEESYLLSVGSGVAKAFATIDHA